MAVTATVQIKITTTGQVAGQILNFDNTVTLSTGVGTEKVMDLTTTPTTIAVPTGARYVLIAPPAGGTINVVVGGTGVALANMATTDPINPSLLSLPASAPSVLLASASGTVSGVIVAFM
jgi:hypothetical protein